MKEFLKKHWKGLACGSAAAVLIAGVMFLYCIGFRITYAPELDNNWDAVSAVAAWVSILVSIAAVIASIVAIVYAIRVPKEIADRQDKIAMFEKRTECYMALQVITACGRHMQKMPQEYIDIKFGFALWLDISGHNGKPPQYMDYYIALRKLEITFMKGELLFERYNIDLLQEIIITGIELIHDTITKENNEKISKETIQIKEKFSNLCREFEDNYLDSIEEEVRIYH